MKKPKVSVIMPVYNGEKYIGKAINSILNQTFKDFELILIDDCGQDRSMDIARVYAEIDDRIRIIYNETNKGIAFSRNVGLDTCKGQYIAIMDDDDISSDDRLFKQADFLDNNPQYDVVGGKAQWIDGEGKVIKQEIDVLKDEKMIKTMFLFYNIFNNSEVMFRKEIIDKNNIKYEDKLLGMEDFKFWIRISKIGSITNIDDLVLLHRMTPNNETNRVVNKKKNERRELFASLQRYSLSLSGFNLTESQYRILNKILNEDGTSFAENKQEMFEMYDAFYQLILQAREKQMDITETMELWFRNLYVDKIALMTSDNMWN